MLARALAAASLAAFLAAAAPARAITVDGQLDPAYALLSTQANLTDRGDAVQGTIDFANGSELDAAYATVDGGTLHLFLAGNLTDWICGYEACTTSDRLEIFLDTGAGGQNTLLANSPSGLSVAGLTFDAGFAPGYLFELYAGGALDNRYTRSLYEQTLPAGGGGVSTYVGGGTNPGAPATLTAGTNPFGIEATTDNRNTAGVAAGCGPATPGPVPTGIELAIPLAAIGNPTGCVRVSVFVAASYWALTNQVLPPLPAGSCNLGALSAIDFANVPGDQFFGVCSGATPAHGSTWGRLKSAYR